MDWALVERGQDFFVRHAAGCGLSLYYISLVGGFSAPLITKVLTATGYLTSNQPKRVLRRLVDTGSMVTDCVAGGRQSLMPGGAGWRAVLRVRFLHAKVRARLLQQGHGQGHAAGAGAAAGAGEPVVGGGGRRWDSATNGVPINQEDLMATLVRTHSTIPPAPHTSHTHAHTLHTHTRTHRRTLTPHTPPPLNPAPPSAASSRSHTTCWSGSSCSPAQSRRRRTHRSALAAPACLWWPCCRVLLRVDPAAARCRHLARASQPCVAGLPPPLEVHRPPDRSAAGAQPVWVDNGRQGRDRVGCDAPARTGPRLGRGARPHNMDCHPKIWP